MKGLRTVLWALGILLALAGRASAEGPLDVARELRSVELGRFVQLFEDESASLRIDDVSAPRFAGRFARASAPIPAFDYAESAYWMRITVENSAPVKRAWLLEVAYPLLDYVTLYIPRQSGGYEARETGDMRPFAQRDLAYRNPVFMLEEAPHSTRTYYLRVTTSGTVTLPLVAWTMKEFIEHQYLDWAGLCVFYGVILVIACYSICLFLFTRELDHLYLSCLVLSVGLMQFGLVGHTFQFLLPHDPALAGRLLPASMALTFYCACVFWQSTASHLLSGWSRAYARYARLYALVLIGLSVVAPYAFTIKLATRSLLPMCVVGVVPYLRLRWKQEDLLMLAGWASAVVGIFVLFMRLIGILPSNLLTVWSLHIGLTLHYILFASSLASRLNMTRAQVDVLNVELVQRVASLQEALARAKDATERAKQAQRVKDEFMATMSHELRTPLNAIINLPQGLLDDFPLRRYATCQRCRATFELEAEESVTERTPCPDCGESPLTPRDVVRYVGRPTRTARYLEMIESAGKHLLAAVNRILELGRDRATSQPLERAEPNAEGSGPADRASERAKIRTA